MKQIVSKNLYLDGLRRIRIPSFIFLAIVVLVQFIIPLIDTLGKLPYREGTFYTVGVESALSPMVLVACIMVPVLTLVMFFAFNRRNSSDFYHSLSYTRQCLFVSWVLAILTATAALLVIGGCLGFSVRAMFPKIYVVNFLGLGQWILSFIGAALFALGCTAIAMSITGTFISNAVGTVLIMIVPRLILFLVRLLVLEATPVLSEEHFLTIFDITHNSFFTGASLGLMAMLGVDDGYWVGYLGVSIFTICVGIVYIFIAAILFKFRKSETAGSGSVNRFVQHLIRIAGTFIISLLGTYLLIEDEDWQMAIIVYCIALIAFFAYEIIITRKWINLVKVLPSLAIIIGLNILVWVSAAGISEAVASNELDSSNVKGVTVTNLMDSVDMADYTLSLNEIEITDPEIIGLVTERYNNDIADIREGSYSYSSNAVRWDSDDPDDAVIYERELLIRTETDSKYRIVRLSQNDLDLMIAAIMENDEYKEAITELPEPLIQTLQIETYTTGLYYGMANSSGGAENLTADECQELFDTLQQELREIDIVDWVKHLTSDIWYDDSNFKITYNINSVNNDQALIPVSQSTTPETYSKVLQLIWSHQDLEGVQELIYGWDEMKDDEYAWYSINVNAFDTITDSSGETRRVGYSNETYSGEEYYDEGEDSHDKVITLVREGLECNGIPQTYDFLQVYYSFSYPLAGDEDDSYYSDYCLAVLPLPSNWAEVMNVDPLEYAY